MTITAAQLLMKLQQPHIKVTEELIRNCLTKDMQANVQEITKTTDYNAKYFLVSDNMGMYIIIKTNKYYMNPELLEKHQAINSIGNTVLSLGQPLFGYGLGGLLFGLITTVAIETAKEKISMKHIYSNAIPQEIKNRAISHPVILNALDHNETPIQWNPNNLTRKLLAKIANATNSATLHISGNCVLLSRCLLYNLTNNKSVLAAKNTYPLTVGIDEDIAEHILFNKKLHWVKTCKNLTEVEESILNYHTKAGIKYYVLDTDGYTIPIFGESAHALNAVIVSENNTAQVQFVDAWKTSNYLPTKPELEKNIKKQNLKY